MSSSIFEDNFLTETIKRNNYCFVDLEFCLPGKSTIAALLERFYDINSGTITIDGVNIRDLDPSWLRGRALGFINQVTQFFFKFHY